ncbi:DNA helicase UvrD [Candidatus Woesearchaeota archaeon]|nr:DNA helicase UvrD [Candidatus Woesearchaeota archaeon]
MRVIADLHIHSPYARATSKDISVKNLERYARIKGVGLMGTGDFTHPKWLAEFRAQLKEDGSGILRTESGYPFVLSAEISNIYSEGGKVRKIHNVLLAGSFEIVEQINEMLGKKGNLLSDGRPIFGKFPCHELVEQLKGIDESIEIIPAHIWTPWFSLFGANSGFDTVEECFRDQARHIHALETGLSSDPAMNWRLSQLDKYALVSNSDLHSFWPWRLGREANVFEMKEITYEALIACLRTKKGFVETIEVDPNFGKYHFTGHRSCNIVMHPADAMKAGNICPKCRRKLTVGVLERVEQLADRQEGFVPEGAIPFRSVIPLSDILAALLGKAVATKYVWQEYYKLVSIKENRSEYDILLSLGREELAKLAGEETADAVMANRNGEIVIRPGYDGVYGVPMLGQKKPGDENKETGIGIKEGNEIKEKNKGQTFLDEY